jgi:RNA polymerase sigma factor FliA
LPTTSELPADADADRTDAQLWRDYQRTGDPERLLLRHRVLVEQIAARMSLGLPAHVERADLVAYGMLGLVDAVGKYDPTRNVRFTTYAAVRIRGAVLDGLRSVDSVPRSVRARSRAVARAEAALQMSLQRRPTETELAAAAGMTVAGLRRLAADAAVGRTVSLEDVRDGTGSAATLTPDLPTEQPGHALEAAERRQAVACAIRGLNDRDRTVINLYYYRGLKLTEIGRLLGVTEARVSQLHTRARTALRKSLLAMDL